LQEEGTQRDLKAITYNQEQYPTLTIVKAHTLLRFKPHTLLDNAKLPLPAAYFAC